MHFRTHLVAAAADRRAQMSVQFVYSGIETRAQKLNPALRNPSCGPTPTTVQESNRPTFRRHQRNRHAVSNRDREQYARHAGRVTIGSWADVQAHRSFTVQPYCRPVHLLTVYDPTRTGGTAERLPALQHVARPCLSEQSEVKGARVTGTRHTLDQPRE